MIARRSRRLSASQACEEPEQRLQAAFRQARSHRSLTVASATSQVMIKNLRRVVIIVAILNLAYFGVEFAVAAAIRSVSLFADSIDFLEDASVNLLIAIGLSWSASARARLGMVLAGILLVPALATVWTAWGKFVAPMPPAPLPLSLTGLGALAINLSCALMLARFRAHGGSLTRAAFLSARNDTVSNVAIIAAGVVTAYTHLAWSDLFVGLGIAAMNLNAAREVWRAAREEHRAADFGRDVAR
jgi:Co/Zn/Cd efflux system component